MTDKIVVLCTCANEEEAERVARELVGARLAACASILPKIRSIYRWKGGIEDSAECLLLIKSARPLFDSLRDAVQRLHSYEVPEIIALPVVDGAANYLGWMQDNLVNE